MIINTNTEQTCQIITFTQATPSTSTWAAFYSRARSHPALVVRKRFFFFFSPEMLVPSNSPVLSTWPVSPQTSALVFWFFFFIRAFQAWEGYPNTTELPLKNATVGGICWQGKHNNQNSAEPAQDCISSEKRWAWQQGSCATVPAATVRGIIQTLAICSWGPYCLHAISPKQSTLFL